MRVAAINGLAAIGLLALVLLGRPLSQAEADPKAAARPAVPAEDGKLRIL